MMGNELQLAVPPKRIVSLVPSQTELLFDLGLKDEVVGITKFCIHPKEWFQTKVRVGGTKKVNFEKIRSLAPDLIIANKEENTQQEIEDLQKEFPVWISDIQNLPQALEMIGSIGELTGKQEAANRIVDLAERSFTGLAGQCSKKRVLYLIWQQPYMSVNQNTFIHDMLDRCGFKNVCETFTDRYPEITAETIVELQPDLIFLSSEPFPFGEKHATEFRLQFPEIKTRLVDGEFFSWYGSRLVQAGSYFSDLHKEIQMD
jgi:ABC-type Fe3+-hydroxamate transport system substrate-binding protein